jgi:hypothetical protein
MFKETEYSLRSPRTVATAADLIGLKELTLITDAPLETTQMFNVRPMTLSNHLPIESHLWSLVYVAVENLRIHFTSSTPPTYPKLLVEPTLHALQVLSEPHLQSYGSTPHTSLWAATNVTLTWDYRPWTLEDHYEVKKVHELKKELRNRGVKDKQILKRKHLVINALLRHDRTNATTLPTLTQ